MGSQPSLSPAARKAEETKLPALNRPKEEGFSGRYCRIRGAQKLNILEDRICKNGVDVRGQYFKGMNQNSVNALRPVRSPSHKRKKEEAALQNYLVEHCMG